MQPNSCIQFCSKSLISLACIGYKYPVKPFTTNLVPGSKSAKAAAARRRFTRQIWVQCSADWLLRSIKLRWSSAHAVLNRTNTANTHGRPKEVICQLSLNLLFLVSWCRLCLVVLYYFANTCHTSNTPPLPLRARAKTKRPFMRLNLLTITTTKTWSGLYRSIAAQTWYSRPCNFRN